MIDAAAHWELSAQGVSHVYGRRHPVEALHDVSLTLPPGTFAGFLGPNGSGKSTLLRNLCGVLHPTEGRVLFGGEDLRRLSSRARARRIAFVPQQVRIDFPFKVKDIVMMGRAPHQGRLGLERHTDIQIVAACMERTRIAHLADRHITSLSGGEAQRVMLAQALAQEAALLILDEPTAHLDIKFQIEIMDLLASLNEERGLTVALSLHDLNLAALYCQHVFLLRQGRLHGEGAPSEVITRVSVREVYGADVVVGRHQDGIPLITLVRQKSRTDNAAGKEDGVRAG